MQVAWKLRRRGSASVKAGNLFKSPRAVSQQRPSLRATRNILSAADGVTRRVSGLYELASFEGPG